MADVFHHSVAYQTLKQAPAVRPHAAYNRPGFDNVPSY
jgi:hypothetical protein